MKTQIFKDWAYFPDRIDKDVNGVSPEFASDHPNWEKENETNKACWNLSHCSGCYRCYHCYDLSDSSGCSDCSNGSRLTDCYRCSGYSDLSGGSNCFALLEKEVCKNPNNMKSPRLIPWFEIFFWTVVTVFTASVFASLILPALRDKAERPLLYKAWVKQTGNPKNLSFQEWELLRRNREKVDTIYLINSP